MSSQTEPNFPNSYNSVACFILGGEPLPMHLVVVVFCTFIVIHAFAFLHIIHILHVLYIFYTFHAQVGAN